jgi:hypothetical protein
MDNTFRFTQAIENLENSSSFYIKHLNIFIIKGVFLRGTGLCGEGIHRAFDKG